MDVKSIRHHSADDTGTIYTHLPTPTFIILALKLLHSLHLYKRISKNSKTQPSKSNSS